MGLDEMNWMPNKNINDKPTLKLTPTSGAKGSRWKLQVCLGNEDRL
jgi:hypothetical protein